MKYRTTKSGRVLTGLFLSVLALNIGSSLYNNFYGFKPSKQDTGNMPAQTPSYKLYKDKTKEKNPEPESPAAIRDERDKTGKLENISQETQ